MLCGLPLICSSFGTLKVHSRLTTLCRIVGFASRYPEAPATFLPTYSDIKPFCLVHGFRVGAHKACVCTTNARLEHSRDGKACVFTTSACLEHSRDGKACVFTTTLSRRQSLTTSACLKHARDGKSWCIHHTRITNSGVLRENNSWPWSTESLRRNTTPTGIKILSDGDFDKQRPRIATLEVRSGISQNPV